jgi:opacity protein-like surface antigen
MKQILSVLCVLFLSLSLNAQTSRSVSLNVYGGYTFQERVKFDAAFTDIQDGFQWGGGLEFFTSYNKSIELKYLRMDTKFPLYGPGGTKLNAGFDDGSIQFIMLGGNSYISKGSNAKSTPFFGASLGVGIVGGENESGTKFAWDAKAGIKINTSSSVSFKLHAYIQSVISAFGSDYWATGTGTIVAVPDYATILQFGLGGAVSLDFRKK